MREIDMVRLKKNHYFEGWYIKNQTKEHTLIMIPGYSVTDEKKEAFIQVIFDDASYYIPYKASQYIAKKNGFYVQVAGNIFTHKGCRLCIHTDEVTIDGILRFGKLNTLSYSIMGPFNKLPGLPCRHEVISMDHALYGTITINEQEISFEHGRGYIEGDHGNSFPENYYWSQSNHFKKPFTSIMAAVADLMVFNHSFIGTTAAILYKGREYRIATYLGAKIRLYTKNRIIITQNDKILKLTLRKSNPVKLAAPINGAMIRSIEEQAVCTVHYFFSVKGHVLIDEVCEYSSFESSFLCEVFSN